VLAVAGGRGVFVFMAAPTVRLASIRVLAMAVAFALAARLYGRVCPAHLRCSLPARRQQPPALYRHCVAPRDGHGRHALIVTFEEALPGARVRPRVLDDLITAVLHDNQFSRREQDRPVCAPNQPFASAATDPPLSVTLMLLYYPPESHRNGSHQPPPNDPRRHPRTLLNQAPANTRCCVDNQRRGEERRGEEKRGEEATNPRNAFY